MVAERAQWHERKRFRERKKSGGPTMAVVVGGQDRKIHIQPLK